jgi:hypothetical protein
MGLWDDMRLAHQALALGEQSAKENADWRNPGQSEGREIVVSVERKSQFIALEQAAGCVDELIEVFMSRDESVEATEPGVSVAIVDATMGLGSDPRRYSFTAKDRVLEQDARTQRISMRRTRRVSTTPG